MLNLIPEHEDSRRALYSFPEAKILKVKEDCILGKHYHKKKLEVFILSCGECRLIQNSVELNIPVCPSPEHMKIGEMYFILPNTYHEFHIKAGSILIGLNSKQFDATDDYKL